MLFYTYSCRYRFMPLCNCSYRNVYKFTLKLIPFILIPILSDRYHPILAVADIKPPTRTDADIDCSEYHVIFSNDNSLSNRTFADANIESPLFAVADVELSFPLGLNIYASYKIKLLIYVISEMPKCVRVYVHLIK